MLGVRETTLLTLQHPVYLEIVLLPVGPWNCPSCQDFLPKSRSRDITLNEVIIRGVVDSELPPNAKDMDLHRLARIANELTWDGTHLWIHHPYLPPQEVPPLTKRY